MKITTANNTPYLNDHYFTSLCLSYFPHEDFRHESENEAFFFLDEANGIISAKVVIRSGQHTANAALSESDIDAPIPMDRHQIAEVVLGLCFIECGRRLFGFIPCWGHLAGLRPVIRAEYYLRRYDESTVWRLFRDCYAISDEKTALSISAAKKAMDEAKKLKTDDCFLYISIPFCPTRCSYCSFVALESKKLKSLIPDYLAFLENELSEKAELMKRNAHTLKSIYIGGGTPSILSPEQEDSLLSAIARNFPMDDVIEYTFEAGRPDTITPEKLALAKDHGVTRISVNPQSTSDEVLKAIGRSHGASLFYEAAELSAKYGFFSRNADIIVGLPEDNDERFDKTISDVLSFGFENITIHSLTVKNASLLSSDVSSYDPRGSEVLKRLSRSQSALTANGYAPYYLYRQKKTVGGGENCGFTLDGKACIYNIASTDETHSIYGCGSGATTKILTPRGVERLSNARYPYEYLKK